jgi:hypothetical protein
MNKKPRTPNYIFTADPMSVNDMQQINIVRKTVRTSNILAKQRAKYSGEKPVIYRVCLKARLGKGNPASVFYRTRSDYQSIKLEDAQRIDVYVQERRS